MSYYKHKGKRPESYAIRQKRRELSQKYSWKLHHYNVPYREFLGPNNTVMMAECTVYHTWYEIVTWFKRATTSASEYGAETFCGTSKR